MKDTKMNIKDKLREQGSMGCDMSPGDPVASAALEEIVRLESERQKYAKRVDASDRARRTLEAAKESLLKAQAEFNASEVDLYVSRSQLVHAKADANYYMNFCKKMGVNEHFMNSIQNNRISNGKSATSLTPILEKLIGDSTAKPAKN